ncbi:hypothetical protein [Paracoccus fistulariae]|uniref:Lipoprotein n=1 Tax=Paracoccus fistulariae TaxID=658446 RepID=A0ABY7SP91_9RHOB|nr:hypothetical protein [Paracoccus fistulariae]MDB6183056.1 hypothetical protein [Paracoccus fistulariae]WCR08850.1 hypothetical protein JHX87_08695 [Paracoccus fistulariae]
MTFDKSLIILITAWLAGCSTNEQSSGDRSNLIVFDYVQSSMSDQENRADSLACGMRPSMGGPTQLTSRQEDLVEIDECMRSKGYEINPVLQLTYYGDGKSLEQVRAAYLTCGGREYGANKLPVTHERDIVRIDACMRQKGFDVRPG